MKNSPAKREQTQPQDTPGVGVSGKVFCPFNQSLCMKDGCELWVSLQYGDQKVGRCAYAWNTILQTEIRQEIEKLRNDINGKDRD